jgi:hypothetical protein
VMRWQKNGWHDEVSRRRRSFNDRRLPPESPIVWRGLVEGETPANRGRDATRRVLTSRGRRRGPAVGKIVILVGSKRLVGCGEFEEHQGASAHPHGSSMEDERWQGRL